ncbi:MAG: DUF4442 domain-containing protein [SAR324 cluster bacterium]|nr:DUF4442 domain-containing protein [SAR324 cluster bacterium]MBF0352882.1 DUF4442 domain-containing protein [SAR324 cluster bacterium]
MKSRKLIDKSPFKTTLYRWVINSFMPYVGAGIKVDSISADFRAIDVSMKLRWYNRNYVGTHFGGSLYAMTDPFLMLMVIQNLGKDYIVWDKAASIEFVKPGTGRMQVQFRLSETELNNIRQSAEQGKVLPEFNLEIRDEMQNLVAIVHKTLYVKKK